MSFYDPVHLVHYLGNVYAQPTEYAKLFQCITGQFINVQNMKQVLVEEGYHENSITMYFYDEIFEGGRWVSVPRQQRDYLVSKYHNKRFEVLYDGKRRISIPEETRRVSLTESTVKPEDFELYCWLMFNTRQMFTYDDILSQFPEYKTPIKVARRFRDWDLSKILMSVPTGEGHTTATLVVTKKNHPILRMDAGEAYRAFEASKKMLNVRRD